MKIPSFFAPLLATSALFFGMSVHPWAAPPQYWPAMQRGEKDVFVRALQLLLRAHGYGLSVNGSFGRATRQDLRQFQTTHQLVASGVTNDPTWEALLVTLHQGSKGPAVLAAQALLRQAGYAVVSDGIFGSNMKAAVLKYQKQTGHTTDGIIGQNTWYELLGGSASGGD